MTVAETLSRMRPTWLTEDPTERDWMTRAQRASSEREAPAYRDTKGSRNEPGDPHCIYFGVHIWWQSAKARTTAADRVPASRVCSWCGRGVPRKINTSQRRLAEDKWRQEDRGWANGSAGRAMPRPGETSKWSVSRSNGPPDWLRGKGDFRCDGVKSDPGARLLNGGPFWG